MKSVILGAVVVIGLTMCQYAPAKPNNIVAQTTQIITPDGKLITCIQNGQLITCF